MNFILFWFHVGVGKAELKTRNLSAYFYRKAMNSAERTMNSDILTIAAAYCRLGYIWLNSHDRFDSAAKNHIMHAQYYRDRFHN